jgi:hypothetical protein
MAGATDCAGVAVVAGEDAHPAPLMRRTAREANRRAFVIELSEGLVMGA